MDADLRAKLYERLRVVRPAGAAAVMPGGRVRELSLKGGNSKGKWHRLLDLLAQLDADALELTDSDGAILELIPLVDRAPETLEEIHQQRLEDAEFDTTEPLSEPHQSVKDAQHIAALALDSADRQTRRFNEGLQLLVDGLRSSQEAMMQMLSLSQARLMAQERELARVITELREIQQQGGSDDDSPLNAMASQVLTKALSPGGGGNPFPPRTNGAPAGNPATNPALKPTEAPNGKGTA